MKSWLALALICTPPAFAERPLDPLNEFGFNLYQTLHSDPGNLVFSPASMSLALTMAYGGARGETADEMAAALQLGHNRDHIHLVYGDALTLWNATTSATLRVANRVFAEQTAVPEPGYVTLTREAYHATIEFVDFMEAAESARLMINEWVADQTADRIRDLLPPDAVHALTRFVLVNAIYFKGKWQTPFDPDHTRPRSFLLSTGEVEVPFMHLKRRFAYAQLDEGWTILEMPYAGGDLRMIWLLPLERGALKTLEHQVTSEQFRQWRQQMMATEVEVALPLFKMEPPAGSMKTPLMQLGMEKAFHPYADFTGIAHLANGLYISDVFHKAFIEVNEEGSEAAAATGIVMMTRTAIMPEEPPRQFIADHPFLFLLMDQRTDAILFMGRVSDPR